MSIAENLASVKKRAEAACVSAGRLSSEVCLIGVSKRQSVESMKEAHGARLCDFGENYVQEYLEKRALMGAPDISWHLIGQIQSNKVGKLLAAGDCVIHSVDSLKLLKVLHAHLDREENKRCLRIFFELRLGDEGGNKTGADRAMLESMLDYAKSCSAFKVEGLMLVPPFFEDPEQSRPYFKQLRLIRDELNASLVQPMKCLSMGMSHDFEVAIQEGATHIRVGSAIFGARL